MSTAIVGMAVPITSDPVPRSVPRSVHYPHVHTNACWWDLTQAGWVCPSAYALPQPAVPDAGQDLAAKEPASSGLC